MTLLQTAHAALATWNIPCTMSYNARHLVNMTISDDRYIPSLRPRSRHGPDHAHHMPYVHTWLTFGTSLGLWMMQPATWNMEWLPTLP
jgi:hypothetical protein